MLYHFAITPEVFEPWSINGMIPAGVVLTQLLRGIAEDGLLANLHAGEWMTHVRKHQRAEGISPDVRDRIESCLRTLHDRNRLVRHPRGSDGYAADDFRWLHWALERHRESPFSAIVASDELVELAEVTESFVVPLSRALDDDSWTERTRTPKFEKTESNLRKHVKPLLAHAQKLTLIDPYMNCREDRFLNTVEHCANLMGRHDGSAQSGIIQIHAGDPETTGPDAHRESVQDRLARWETSLKPIARHTGHTFRVLLWKRKPGGKLLHDRYLITDQCGIKAPGGLDFLPDDEEERASLTTWAMLDDKVTRNILLNQFHHAKSPYQYLGSTRAEPAPHFLIQMV